MLILSDNNFRWVKNPCKAKIDCNARTNRPSENSNGMPQRDLDGYETPL